MAESFGDDVTLIILLQLPVKSLFRFRTVSKRWNNLINNKKFINLYSTMTKTRCNLVVEPLYTETSIRTIEIELKNSLQENVELVFPVNPRCRVTKIIGSCNGLLCLCYMGFGETVYIIWNPFTRKHVKVPNNIIKNKFDKNVVHGFGYDSVSDDYKVVMLVESWFKDFLCFGTEFYVSSLKSSSWRKTLVIPHCRISVEKEHGVLVSGALHWVVENVGIWDTVVLAFDLATEGNRIVSLPVFTWDNLALVSELGGCLSVVYFHSLVREFRVWVMKDYGVGESWTMILTVPCSEIPTSLDTMVPLVYSESGDEVLMMLSFGVFGWYNLEKKSIRFVEFPGLPDVFLPVICLESLVSLGENAEKDELYV